MVKKVLMVCLGNTCRSPIAEAVMQDVINKAGLQEEWKVDSAAIANWHCGDPADERAQRILYERSLPCTHQARQIEDKDFEEFDYIIGMDEENMTDLNNMAPDGSKAKLLMLGDFGVPTAERIIQDPYTIPGNYIFALIFDKCVLACNAFFKEALANKV